MRWKVEVRGDDPEVRGDDPEVRGDDSPLVDSSGRPTSPPERWAAVTGVVCEPERERGSPGLTRRT